MDRFDLYKCLRAKAVHYGVPDDDLFYKMCRYPVIYIEAGSNNSAREIVREIFTETAEKIAKSFPVSVESLMISVFDELDIMEVKDETDRSH